MRTIKVSACFAGSLPCPYYELSDKVHYCTKMMHSLELGLPIMPWCPLEKEKQSDKIVEEISKYMEDIRAPHGGVSDDKGSHEILRDIGAIIHKWRG